MPKAVWNGAVLAESEHTEVVEGSHYFPPERVNRAYLKKSRRLVWFEASGGVALGNDLGGEDARKVS